jgi:predicted small integral membrane protein
VSTQSHNELDVAVHKLLAMRLLAWLGNTGTTVAILAGITALQITLIAAGNITDFGNKEFVVQVLAMDTTFRSPNTMWHAITDPSIVIGVYITIIVWGCLTAIMLISACIAWARTFVRHRGSDAARLLSTSGWIMKSCSSAVVLLRWEASGCKCGSRRCGTGCSRRCVVSSSPRSASSSLTYPNASCRAGHSYRAGDWLQLADWPGMYRMLYGLPAADKGARGGNVDQEVEV